MFPSKLAVAAIASFALISPVTALLGNALTFVPSGLGACGQYNASVPAVALNTQDFDNGQNCFKAINVTYGGKSVTATVVDICPGCPSGGLDFSVGLFRQLANSSDGPIGVSWGYV